MKQNFLFYPVLLLISGLALAEANPLGERAAYKINNDRSSWLIRGGNAQAVVINSIVHPRYGNGYLVKINYELDVRFKGQEKGSVGLFVPPEVLADQFLDTLRQRNNIAYGSFDIEHLGNGNFRDAEGLHYNHCAIALIKNIDLNAEANANSAQPEARILWFRPSENHIKLSDLQINLKMHNNIDVLGGVQLDVTGKILGFELIASFDFTRP